MLKFMASSSIQPKLQWYQNPINWFLIVATVMAAGFFWWVGGQPGIPQEDGVYTCEHDYASQGLGNMLGMNPSATVVGGEVSSVNDASGDPTNYSNYRRTGPATLEVTVDGTEYSCER